MKEKIVCHFKKGFKAFNVINLFKNCHKTELSAEVKPLVITFVTQIYLLRYEMNDMYSKSIIFTGNSKGENVMSTDKIINNYYCLIL